MTTIQSHVQLIRLKLLRPPPDRLCFSPGAAHSCIISLAVGVQDDYGIDFDTFGQLKCENIPLEYDGWQPAETHVTDGR